MILTPVRMPLPEVTILTVWDLNLCGARAKELLVLSLFFFIYFTNVILKVFIYYTFILHFLYFSAETLLYITKGNIFCVIKKQ